MENVSKMRCKSLRDRHTGQVLRQSDFPSARRSGPKKSDSNDQKLRPVSKAKEQERPVFCVA